jgi:hypothetical protein
VRCSKLKVYFCVRGVCVCDGIAVADEEHCGIDDMLCNIN